MSGNLPRLGDVFKAEDIVATHLFARSAMMVPTKHSDILAFLGESTHTIATDSFRGLFDSIKDSGNYWLTHVAPLFCQRCEAMMRVTHQHYHHLLDAVAVLEDMLNLPYVRRGKLEDVDIEEVIRETWWHLSNEAAKNYVASEHFVFFAQKITAQKRLIVEKLKQLDEPMSDNVRQGLVSLLQDSDRVSVFTIQAEGAIRDFWDYWSRLSDAFEKVKLATSQMATGLDLTAFYEVLLDILHRVEAAERQTRHLQSCFQSALEYLEFQPPGFVPLGAYKDSCSSIKVILSAECQDEMGQWQYDELDITHFDPLRTDISNENGRLRYSQDYPICRSFCYVPGGNFRQTCRNVRTVLHAQCAMDCGDHLTSSLDITYDLNPEISHVQGALVKKVT